MMKRKLHRKAYTALDKVYLNHSFHVNDKAFMNYLLLVNIIKIIKKYLLSKSISSSSNKKIFLLLMRSNYALKDYYNALSLIINLKENNKKKID